LVQDELSEEENECIDNYFESSSMDFSSLSEHYGYQKEPYLEVMNEQNVPCKKIVVHHTTREVVLLSNKK
jgi:uncharacterized YccA/Bax inhibitor family protein